MGAATRKAEGTMTKRSTLCAVLVACSILCGISTVLAAPLMLQATQDNSSMEKTISKFLRDAHQLQFDVIENKGKPDSMVLSRDMKGGKVPDYSVVISTGVSEKDNKGRVLQRLVVVMLVTDIKVPAEKRAAVLEAMNKLNNENDFAMLVIDHDDEIGMSWVLNVTEAGLPAEAVYDIYQYVNEAWASSQPVLAKALGH